MNKSDNCNRHVLRAAILGAAAWAITQPQAALAQDAFVRYFADTPNAIAGFTPAPGNVFYKANFGANAGFTRWTFNGSTWSSTTAVGPTDLSTFEQSLDVNAGTLPPTATGGTSLIGDLQTNPAPITITRVTSVAGVPTAVPITYEPGTIAFVIDRPTNVMSSGNIRYDLTKFGYFYDLRQVGTATGGTGVDRDGDGLVEWNDVFQPVFSKGDLRTVASYSGTTISDTSHHFAWSSDGQSVYFIDASLGTVSGGLWKANITSTGAAALSRILTVPGEINTEPSVVSSSVRNFGGGSGDQIIVIGSAEYSTPSAGGASYVVDNGTTVSAPQTLVSSKQVQAFLEVSSVANFTATGADAQGNVYLYNNTTGALIKYDTDGLLSKAASRAEQFSFQTTLGGSSFAQSMFDMKFRTSTFTGPDGAFPVTEMIYSDSATGTRGPVGIYMFAPGDFNRDGAVDADDVNLFKPELDLRGVTTASVNTTSPYPKLDPEDFKFDLNGSLQLGTGSGIHHAVVIDWKDVKIFQQAFNNYQVANGLPNRLSDGDVDMDFDVDSTDLATLAANYNATGKLFTQGNLTSVRIAATDKDDVNYADLVTLAANWTGPKPAPGALGSIPAADLDRAFAISANGSLHHYTAKGSGFWSSISEWSGGNIPNSPGAVASFLTKPQDDTTVVVDGSYTVGQLNFDNYFTYSLAGGTLNLNGNGPAAEINAFAASPNINSAIVAQTNTNLTVTYAADTLSLNGPLTIAAGATLAKQGPGLLKITGGGSGTGTLAARSGNVEISGNLTVGALGAPGDTGTLVTSGGASTRLTIADTASPSVSTVNALTLGAGTTLDLNDNVLTLPASHAAAALAALTTGYAAGNWNGAGIASTTAANDPQDLHTLAYINHGTSFTILYTIYGDANLNGQIDGDDYALADAGLATAASSWTRGDFNYSGSVTSADFALLDRSAALLNGGIVSPSLLAQREAQFGATYVSSLLASIPEPSSLATAALALLPTLRRRRA